MLNYYYILCKMNMYPHMMPMGQKWGCRGGEVLIDNIYTMSKIIYEGIKNLCSKVVDTM